MLLAARLLFASVAAAAVALALPAATALGPTPPPPPPPSPLPLPSPSPTSTSGGASPPPPPLSSLSPSAAPSTAASPSPRPALFQAANVVVLRVGATNGPALSSALAPLHLDEVGLATGAVVSTMAVSGVSVSGADYTQGSLTRSGDGRSLVLAGVAAAAGTAPGAAAPFFGDAPRAVVRVDMVGAVTTAIFSSSQFGGLLLGACAFDQRGVFVVGNSTSPAVGVAFAADSSVDALSVRHAALSTYTSCAAAQSGALYLIRARGPYAYVDKATGADVLSASASGGLVAVAAPSSHISPSPYSGRQIIVNAAETRFWVGVVTATVVDDGGVYSGNRITSMSIMVAATFRVTGLALSADEATLYFTARQPAHALYSVAASCASACAPTLLLAAGAGSEFRGVALSPVSALPLSPPPPATATATAAAVVAAASALASAAPLAASASATQSPDLLAATSRIPSLMTQTSTWTPILDSGGNSAPPRGTVAPRPQVEPGEATQAAGPPFAAVLGGALGAAFAVAAAAAAVAAQRAILERRRLSHLAHAGPVPVFLTQPDFALHVSPLPEAFRSGGPDAP
jgi:hypothetical protein